MRTTMLHRTFALMLAVVMLTIACMTHNIPGNVFAVEAYAAEAEAQYALDVTASINKEDHSIIDVVITAKNFKQELIAVTFDLNFDKTLVEGVITENDKAQMDAFMTVTPTYTFSYGGITTTMPSIEQICYYDEENGLYECRFCDLLDYPYAQAGQDIHGFRNDGDLVITIQFRIRDGVAPGTKIEFSATNVTGTTTVAAGIHSVPGTGDSAVINTVTAEQFPINLAQVELGNALNLNFLFPVDAYADWTGCYAVLTKSYADREDASITVAAADWEDKTSGGKQYKRIGFHNISAKEMADEISIVVYNANGQPISTPYSDSIVNYLDRMLDKNSNPKFRRLAVDMLNYGAAAQTQFHYNEGNLANAILTDTQKTYGTTTDAVCVNNQAKGNNVRGASVSLENNIVMNVYFTNQTANMTATAIFTNHNGENVSVKLTSTDSGKNGYCFQVNRLAVADMRTMVTVICYNADGSVYGSVTDSVEGYVARTGLTKAINQAIMKFSDSAIAYLH